MRPSFSIFHWSLRPRYRTLSTLPLAYRMSTRPLDFYAGPMVWIDCEMTGLDTRKDKILEVAVLISNGNLDLVDDGLQYAIKTEKNVLDGMDQWCITQHGQSGLTKACLESTHTREYVTSEILKYIKRWIPQPRSGVLAGSSVHADRAFLVEEMPEVIEHLHYRVVDVSTIKELVRRWFPTKFYHKPKSSHRALDDIRGSIQELQWYRENVFTPPGSFRKESTEL